MGCRLHSASHCERSPRGSRQHCSASSALTLSESIAFVVPRQFWRWRKGSHLFKRRNWLACAVGRPWLTWSNGSIVADWLRSRSLLAEDANRGTRPAIAPALLRLPSDHPTGAQTGRRHGH
jgi:hypothetical protein